MLMTAIEQEERWNTIEMAITKVKQVMKEPDMMMKVSSKEYMKFYESAYTLCIHRYSVNVYDRCKAVMEEFVVYTVLPSLLEKRDECLLIELLKMWSNYQVMVKWLSKFFAYVDRYRRGCPSLNDTSILCFHKLVFHKLYGEFRNAVIYLIDQERDGKQIDRDLLKNVLNFFEYIGIRCSVLGELPVGFYKNDFDRAMLEDTAIYYRCRASQWFLENSNAENMSKVEHCLKQEMDRANCYLQFINSQKLLQIVEHELLSVLGSKLQGGFLSEGQTFLSDYQGAYEELLTKCATLELEDETRGGPKCAEMDLDMN